MTVTRLIARPMLASLFVVAGVNAFKNAPKLAQKAAPVTDKVAPLLQRAVPTFPDDPATLVRLNAGVQVGAAGMLATGRMPRTSAAVLAASLVPTTLAGHAFWREEDPQVRATQRLQFFKNISVLGGVLLAAVDTDGQPGVAWRVRRAANDVRRETRRLARDAKREARLARATLT